MTGQTEPIPAPPPYPADGALNLEPVPTVPATVPQGDTWATWDVRLHAAGLRLYSEIAAEHMRQASAQHDDRMAEQRKFTASAAQSAAAVQDMARALVQDMQRPAYEASDRDLGLQFMRDCVCAGVPLDRVAAEARRLVVAYRATFPKTVIIPR